MSLPRPSPASPDPTAPLSPSQTAFYFVKSLAAELSNSEVELPGFPQIVARIRRALEDENVSTEKVARLVGAEPVIAARLLRMANSAALNPQGKPVVELPSAILRVGLNVVRSTTIAFAVEQLRNSPRLKGLEKPLDALWERSVLVASLSHVIARRRTRLSPDMALLAGLLQGIGRLYILTRAAEHRVLFVDFATYQAIERDWHLGLACALLEHWNVPEAILQAVRESEDFAREPFSRAALSDVLMAASLLAMHQAQPDLLEARLRSVRAIAPLELDRRTCERLCADSAEEIAGLREALRMSG